jgi:hypothetical protein
MTTLQPLAAWTCVPLQVEKQQHEAKTVNRKPVIWDERGEVSTDYVPSSLGFMIIPHMRDDKWVLTIFLVHKVWSLLHIWETKSEYRLSSYFTCFYDYSTYDRWKLNAMFLYITWFYDDAKYERWRANISYVPSILHFIIKPHMYLTLLHCLNILFFVTVFYRSFNYHEIICYINKVPLF